MSEARKQIERLLETFDEASGNHRQLMEQIKEICFDNGDPEDCREYYAMALGYVGQAWFWAWDGIKSPGYYVAFIDLLGAYHRGNRNILEELGYCYYGGYSTPDGSPEMDKAMAVWKEGMELGDHRCALRYCLNQVETGTADETTVAALEALVADPDHPEVDACAVLYQYYAQNGDEDKAWEWREKGLDLGSGLMQSIVEDEAEEEVGEDDWHPKTDMSMFFGADEDEDDSDGDDEPAGATHPGYPEVGDKYVILALTDDRFRIVRADASDWRSLPALIGAERCDDLRCEKFRQVAGKLGLKGTLLGQLDRDAFRKSSLKPNWHASQWYDGYADLMGDMVICLEDASHNPFSFDSEAQAQQVIDALCR